MPSTIRRTALALAFAVSLPCTTSPAAAQEAVTERNSVLTDVALGDVLLASGSLERRFTPWFTGSVGLGVMADMDVGLRFSDWDAQTAWVIPLRAGFLSHPAGSSHFEAGIGATFITSESLGDTDEWGTVLGTGTLGYRYQQPTGGIVFRAGVTPMWNRGETFVNVSIGSGYTF